MNSFDIPFLKNFYHGFHITASCGNNAFSYSKRNNKKIFVPPVSDEDLDSLAVGENIAFSECEADQEQNYFGLKHFLYLRHGDKDIVIVDNHNHVFFFWVYALTRGTIFPGGTLVHVDQHKDTRDPQDPPGFVLEEASALDKAFHYTNFVLNVGNFIQPAVQLGIFSKLEMIQNRSDFEKDPLVDFVLDIDMDIFARDMQYIDEAYKIKKLKKLIAQSKLITIATSPFFMDQSEAIRIIKQLF